MVGKAALNDGAENLTIWLKKMRIDSFLMNVVLNMSPCLPQHIFGLLVSPSAGVHQFFVSKQKQTSPAVSERNYTWAETECVTVSKY